MGDLIKIVPNAAGVWVPCPGSAVLYNEIGKLPDNEERHQSKLEGRAFHELAELRFADPEFDLESMIDVISSHEVAYTREMVDGVIEYCDDVFSECERLNSQPFVENEVDFNSYHPGMVGFVDVSTYKPNTELIVWDAKYGRRIVEVYECWQLLLYAAGKLRQAGITCETDPDLKITLKIVQPRSYHRDGPIRSWSIGWDELFLYEAQIETSLYKIRQGEAECIPGNHCKSCAVVRGCKAIANTIYSIHDYVTDTQSVELDGVDLSVEYEMLQRFETLFKARKDAIETQLEHELSEGNPYLLHYSEPKYGRTVWKGDNDEVKSMCELFGVDAVKEVNEVLFTPTQLIKKGVDEDVIKHYSEKPKRGMIPKLKSENSRLVFSNNNTTKEGDN